MLDDVTDINFETLFGAEKKTTETVPKKDEIKITAEPEKNG